MAASGVRGGRLRRVVDRFGAVEWTLLVALVLLTAAVAAGVGVQDVDDRALRGLPWSDAPDSSRPLAHASYLLVLYGSPEISIVVTLLVAGAWSWRCRTLVPLQRIAPPVLIGAVVVLALKILVGRSGPPGSDPVRLVGYYPSGHTAMGLLCAGALAAAVAAQRPHLRAPLRVAALAWTLTLVAALLYHRYHWVSDIVASALLGLLILRLTDAQRSPTPSRPEVRSLRPVHPSSDDAS